MFREAAGSLIHLPINTDTEGGMTLINCAIDRKNNGAHTSNWSTRATREHFRTQAINHAACLSWSQPPLHHPVPGQTCPEQSILQPGTELSHTGLIPGAGRRVVTAQFQKSASPLFVPQWLMANHTPPHSGQTCQPCECDTKSITPIISITFAFAITVNVNIG